MTKFVHQGFLQRFPYEGIDLSSYRIAPEKCVLFLDYKEQSALSDISGKRIRTMLVSELDSRLATMEDWKTLTIRLRHINSIILLDDRTTVENNIVKSYADRTLRVYIHLLLLENKKCMYAQMAS